MCFVWRNLSKHANISVESFVCPLILTDIFALQREKKKAPWMHEPRLLLHRNTQMHWHANKHKHTPYDRLSHGGRFL